MSVTNWVLKGKPFSQYRVWLALDSYIIILEKYGFDVWRNLNKYYYSLEEPISGPDEVKLDFFARVFCKVTETNVAPYFEWWGYVLTEETLSECQQLPDMDEDLMARYDAADHTTVTDHGTCEEGWLPFGGNCFFVSTDDATFYDAEGLCAEAGGHLASCLSTSEAYFLKDQLDSMSLNQNFFVGIESL